MRSGRSSRGTTYTLDPSFTPGDLIKAQATGTYRDEYAPAGYTIGPSRFFEPVHGDSQPVYLRAFAQSCTTFDAAFTNPPAGSGQTVELRLYAFPFWAATLDGRPVPLSAASDGVAGIENVPAGPHVVHVQVTPTAWQAIARIIAVVAFLMFFLLLIYAHPLAESR